MEKKCARRMSNVYDNNQRTKVRENNLLNNHFNLPLVNLSRASPTPTSKPIRITAQLIVSEQFGSSQLFENDNNTLSQDATILKINEESNGANSRIISKYVTYKQKEQNQEEERNNAYKRSKSIQFGEEDEKNINDVKQFRRGSLLKDYGHHINQYKQKTESRLNSYRELSSTIDTPVKKQNNKQSDAFINWDEVSNNLEINTCNKISLQQAAALLGKSAPIRDNEFAFREKKTHSKRQSHQQKIYHKLRIIFLFVRAVIRILKPYRQSQKKQLTEHNNLVKLREPHQKFINMYGLRNIKGEYKKFLMMVSNKILHYFEEKKYAQECSQIWSKIGEIDKDTRKTRFCAFSQMFFSNLELLTRRENLPELISHQLNTCLFKTKDSMISQFVSKRVRLYSQKVTTLSQNEKILIAAEFFFFQIVAPSFVEIVNENKTSKTAHKNQNLLYCFGIISLLQMIFISHFKDMALATSANVRPIQRIMSVKTDETTGQMEAKIDVIQQLEQDELQLIFGCFKNDSITQIISEKQNWSDKIEKTFNQIISNIWCHIQI